MEYLQWESWNESPPTQPQFPRGWDQILLGMSQLGARGRGWGGVLKPLEYPSPLGRASGEAEIPGDLGAVVKEGRGERCLIAMVTGVVATGFPQGLNLEAAHGSGMVAKGE